MILDKGESVPTTDDPEGPPPAYEDHAEFSSNASSSRVLPQRGASHPREKHGEVVYTYTPGRDDPEPPAPSFPAGHIQQTHSVSHEPPLPEAPPPSWRANPPNHPSIGCRRLQFADSPSPYSTRSNLSRGETSPPLPTSTPSELLNPPPPSFSRTPQPGFPYGPFPLLAHFSQGIGIDGGFAAMPPPTHIDPHPFATHDVNEEDWGRFLDDVRRAGSLSPLNKFAVGAAPFAVGIGIVGGGILVAKGIYDHLKTKKHACAAEIVDHWNNNFFHHRQMEVSLCRGPIKYSGIDKIPPDMPDSKGKTDPSDDPESGDESAGEATTVTANSAGGCTKKEARRERREMKREKRQQRRQCRKEEKEVRSKPWRLVISYRPLPSA